jgi:sensor histidine kinase YesM
MIGIQIQIWDNIPSFQRENLSYITTKQNKGSST